ncbi:MAG: pentapeptide repeat-containing protein [Caldilineaceae bacterium]
MAGGDNLSSVKKRLTFALLFAVIITAVTFIGLRYIIIRPITCMPNCIGENLLGRDLQGLNLARTNFVEANLQGADLRNANLRQVDLSGANLFNANLRNADLSEAQLIGANLTGADLGGSSLSGANLTGAILDQADLTAVNLTDVALQGASFGEAKLTNARLNQANLNGIQFAKANLSGALLDEAALSGANLSSADLSGASLRKADLTGAWLNLTNLTGADLSGADLLGSRLIGAQLTSANLAESRLQGAVVIGATLNGANVRGADLRQLRGLANQLNADDLHLDPVLAELNELQQSALRKDVEMQGLAYDLDTQWEAALQPPEVALAVADKMRATIVTGPEETTVAVSTAQHMKVNFYINALRNAPNQPGAYEIDFYLDSLWEEPTLTDEAFADSETAGFWEPALEVINAGQVQDLGRRYDRSVEPETNLRLRQRLQAIFAPQLDLRRFPFDKQVVSLQIESAEYDSESLLLDFVGLVEPIVQSEIPYSQPVPRGRYIDVTAIDPEWRVQEVNIVQVIRVLPYDNSAWSQFRVDLVIRRVATGYLWRIWAVLACLWLLVGSVLLIDSDALPIRLWLLFLLFWIVVAFQGVLSRVLPLMNAFTLLDLYLLLCYFSIVLMALLVLVIKGVHLYGRQRWAHWVNWGSVILYPTIFVLINLWLLSNAFR